jgi:hypothetical protein
MIKIDANKIQNKQTQCIVNIRKFDCKFIIETGKILHKIGIVILVINTGSQYLLINEIFIFLNRA